jgi:hypothetical protein
MLKACQCEESRRGKAILIDAATRPEALMKGIVFPSSALEYS